MLACLILGELLEKAVNVREVVFNQGSFPCIEFDSELN